MAWTCSVESAELASLSRTGYVPSPTAITIPMPAPFCIVECATEDWHALPFGMTSARSEATISRQLISSTAASPARTSALQGLAQAWQASAPAFTGKSTAWSAKSHPDSSFWRTSQPSALADFDRWSAHLPSSGTIAAGLVYPPLMWERRTKGSAGSFWPTATTSDAKGARRHGYMTEGNAGTTLLDFVTLWPTPVSSDGERGVKGDKPGRQGGPSLAAAAVMWKTPTAGGTDSNYEAYLARMARKTDPKSRGKTEPTNLSMQVGGQLNPTWVEWLMAYPSGWTVLEPWAMQWFLSKRAKPS
jgi:hypothetical protein